MRDQVSVDGRWGATLRSASGPPNERTVASNAVSIHPAHDEGMACSAMTLHIAVLPGNGIGRDRRRLPRICFARVVARAAWMHRLSRRVRIERSRRTGTITGILRALDRPA
jgi:hypothetical protein